MPLPGAMRGPLRCMAGSKSTSRSTAWLLSGVVVVRQCVDCEAVCWGWGVREEGEERGPGGEDRGQVSSECYIGCV